MRQWIRSALVQIMACRLFGAKPLTKPVLGYCQFWLLGTNFIEIWIKIQNFSFAKNASENIVCKMAAILSRGRRVNDLLVILCIGASFGLMGPVCTVIYIYQYHTYSINSSDVVWASEHKITINMTVCSTAGVGNNKVNKSLHYWFLWGKSTVDPADSSHKMPVMHKVFPHDSFIIWLLYRHVDGLSARKAYLQCLSTGVTSFSH